MNITTYIRKEDEHLWNLIENKAQWIHEQLNRQAQAPASRTPIAPRPIKKLKKPIVLAGMMTAAELDVPECPRHHVPKSECLDKH